jgi:hypothetical protein
MDASSYSRPGAAQPPYRASPAPTVRRWDWNRRDPRGFLRMAIVFVGAFIGGFVVWPMIRPAFIADDQPQYADDARSYMPPAPPAGNHGRRR